MKKIITILCLTLLIVSCGSSKKVTTKKGKQRTVKVDRKKKVTEKKKPVEVVEEDVRKETPEVYANKTEEYIAVFSDIAKDEMIKYRVPASITLAQGILESGSGQGRLSVEANNHFGIKCHNWEGAKIYHDDDASQECFRKYKNAKYSFRDHSLFLAERKRYSKLFDLEKDDYQGWAKGLRAAGYATDKKYPNKLISLIERYQLYRFDADVLGKEITTNDKHAVIKGDTLYSISRRYNISVTELKDLNSLEDNDLFIGQILFVKPIPKDY
ncbi:glucosaminidase domain-containing protein [Psychroserpens sp. NJDZ02]|uniref:glucosaminidase domain-containing protein n=1 Tax=Psychroserpens sp. NJDZ02 TaxID=2570561 RepID=UPI0010A7D4D2|nr:glucosaminidase domain-containing protein [Psychroserpens sp. NJDZ02]QCE41698.1 LysM peptidoglycan-binding domain-containing protein [Psychroserpens sp. NJDZ02]